MNWLHSLAHKAFWIYYLRLFQNFDGDRVTACCDFFGVRKTDLEETILHSLYQTHRYDEEEVLFPTLSLPTTVGATVEIEFQNAGPNEQFFLEVNGERVPLVSVDVDDVRAPCFPLTALPDVAARLRGDLARTYGELLLYKLTYVTPDDDLDALDSLLRAAFPGGLFTLPEQEHILAGQRRTWHIQQRHSRPLHEIAHPAWHALIGA
jgi:hypothetical protein